MNDLITISMARIGGEAIQSVNARDLHAFLDVGKIFGAWISDAGVIAMHGKIAKLHNRPTAFLPDYTEENLTRSLTELLKEHGAGISAVKANTVLVALGILEEQTRPGSKGITHKFRVLTEAGQKYGKNLISPQNERETQPHYYVATFPALLDLINSWLQEAA